jgi:ribosomal protein S27AE
MGFFENFNNNQNFNNNRGGFESEKRKYPDESTRMLYIKTGHTAVIRVLSDNTTRSFESYIEGPSRQSRAGKSYTPRGYVTQVSHIPVFEGRCALSKIIPNHKPTTKTNLEVFDFGYYHVAERDSGKSISVSHQPCLSKTVHPNPDACEHCSWQSPRILGGRRVLQFTNGQMSAFVGHEAHIMQFAVPMPGADGGAAKFFGKKVQAVGAGCSECGHEVFSERKLQVMSNLEIIDVVTRREHECPNCGHRGYLAEALMCGEEQARRGEISWKNLEINRERAARGTQIVFNSDLQPFESLASAAERLGIPESDYTEAINRPWDFQAASGPYGLNPDDFKDSETYVKAVTNQQIRQLNWIIHGTARDRYWNNPFFG